MSDIDFREHYPSTMPPGDVYEGDWVCTKDGEDWPCSFVAALLADAAIGRAVRSAEDVWHFMVEYDRRGGGYIVKFPPEFHGGKWRSGTGPDLPSAITAALAKWEASRG